MTLAVEVLDLATVVVRKGNPNAASDGAVGALLARTAVRAAGMNVRINLPTIGDEAVRASLAARCDAILARTEPLEIAAIAATGLGTGV
jgi:formiminotetrahydrofolate cyclodeaminase